MNRPEHTAARPGWLCRVDGQPWPCPTARAQLTAEHVLNVTALAILMGVQMHACARDLGDQADPADLYRRFLSWVRHPLAARETAGPADA